jgi:c-di-GMP-binding flagellar brake protein YcgR
MTSPEDRRQHGRVAVRVPLYVELPGGIFQKHVAIEARDISLGGLSFNTRRRVPEGSEARLMVARLGDLPDLAQIEARVVHTRLAPDGESFTVGVSFTRLVGVTAEELIRRLEGWTSARSG